MISRAMLERTHEMWAGLPGKIPSGEAFAAHRQKGEQLILRKRHIVEEYALEKTLLTIPTRRAQSKFQSIASTSMSSCPGR